MNSGKPPRLAAWILQVFGPELNHEALAGDLNEAFQQGRSKAWYWRQVLAAVQGRMLRQLLASIVVVWWIIFDLSVPTTLSRTAEIVVFTAVYFASLFAPGMMRRRLRVLLALLIMAIYALLWHHQGHLAQNYPAFFWIVAFNFAFYRERPVRRYRLTIRELVYGDAAAERQRLMEKLHLDMLKETDPHVRQAYAESIAALNREIPAAKAAE
jgi:hypothetical protein